jgi:hypothetical protein
MTFSFAPKKAFEKEKFCWSEQWRRAGSNNFRKS